MYLSKKRRRRQALGLSALAAIGVAGQGSKTAARADSLYIGPTNGIWSTTTYWSPTGAPAGNTTADCFKASTLVFYTTNASGGAILNSVQVANGSTLSFPIGTTPVLSTGGFYVGGTVTGLNGAINTSTGAGTVTQSVGTLNVTNPQALLEVDSASLYSMSGSTTVINAYNEQLSGTFNENSGSNLLMSNSTLNNSGIYNDFNAGIVSADLINNTGIFNQSSGAIVHGTSSNFTAFVNNGTYLFNNSGTFSGSMNNTAGAIAIISGAAIPFTLGIVNDGQLTLNSSGLNSSSGTYPNAINGGSDTGPVTGNITVTGGNSPGIVTLSGLNNYTGTISVTGGTLDLASPLGTSANNFGGAAQGNVTVGAAGTLILGADLQISNTAAFTIYGNVNLQSHNESIGSLTISGGQIQQSGGVALGVTSGQVTVGKGNAFITGGLRAGSNFNFNVATNDALTVSGPLSALQSNMSIGMVLTGGGTLAISGQSLLSSIDAKQGILQFVEGGTLGGFNASTNVESTGVLNLAGQTISIGDLQGGGTVALGAGTLNIYSTGSTFSGTLSGTGFIVKNGLGTLVFTGSDLATGPVTVNGGTLTVASGASIGSTYITSGVTTTLNLNGTINNSPVINASGVLNIGPNTGSGILIRYLSGLNVGPGFSGNGQVNISPSSTTSTRQLIVTGSLSLTPSGNGWSSQLDLANNDMVVSLGSLSMVTSEVASGFNQGNWQGTGITSSVAAADTTHLSALGVILNNDGTSNVLYGKSSSSIGSTFDGYTPGVQDVLVKFTYFGDSNLDGKVDGSDYSLIDNGYLSKLTGWYNGDFNYDGIVNGSDYTLIDNAYNSQGAPIAAIDAAPSATITSQLYSPVAVPEPATLVLLLAAPLALRSRRIAKR